MPSPKLKDVRMSSDQLKSAYQQLLHGMVVRNVVLISKIIN